MRRKYRALLVAAAMLVAAIAGKTGLLAEVPAVPAANVRAATQQALPEGPGKADLVRLCDGCHDLSFTMSHREDEAGWTWIVNDMRSRGTDGTEEQFLQIIAYLTTHFGKADRREQTERPERHAALEILANRTKVLPGEQFALGLRLVAADGWRLKGSESASHVPDVTWVAPQALSIGSPTRRPADLTALTVFPTMVAQTASTGSAVEVHVRVEYEVCRETCVAEAATASISVPIGQGGAPAHSEAFSHAGAGAPTHPREPRTDR